MNTPQHVTAFGVTIPRPTDGYLVLATGDYFDPVSHMFCVRGYDPIVAGRPVRPDDISSVCVALSLASTCRFAGQTLPTKQTIGLSDAQHSIHVAEIILDRASGGAALVMQALHHDDGECFGLGSDIPAPTKCTYPELFGPLREAQDRLRTAICWSLRVPSFENGAWQCSETVWEQHPLISEADQVAFALETTFMPRTPRWPVRRAFYFAELVNDIERRGVLTGIEAAAAWLAWHEICATELARHGPDARVRPPSHSQYITARQAILAIA